jgi:hypothetical protein
MSQSSSISVRWKVSSAACLKRHWAIVLCLITLIDTGCASRRSYAHRPPRRQGWNDTQVGAGVGAVGGAVLGGVIGHQFGRTGAGALVGGLAGTATGALVGNAKEVNDERDYYARQAAHYEFEQARERAAMLSNSDIINMTRAGCGDRIIMNAIQTRGGRFDTSPEQLIVLRQYGVSDEVVEMMQARGGR